eukprot:888294-Pelagomonas_calceolata.AAC.2
MAAEGDAAVELLQQLHDFVTGSAYEPTLSPGDVVVNFGAVLTFFQRDESGQQHEELSPAPRFVLAHPMTGRK